MDIAEFQKKLADLRTLANGKGKKIPEEEVRDFFREDQLQDSQMEKIYAYLKLQGITVEGREETKEPEKKGKAAEAAPLTEEEKAYLQEYQESLQEIPRLTAEQEEELFLRHGKGDTLAGKRLMEAYLPEVISIALAYHREGFFIGDMIQEGNMALVAALEEPESLDRERLLGKVREGIRKTVGEHQQQKDQDEYLVEKVRRLEEDVRALTEDTSEKYSVKELSIILDMSEEEIMDVLRLTGDDK